MARGKSRKLRGGLVRRARRMRGAGILGTIASAVKPHLTIDNAIKTLGVAKTAKDVFSGSNKMSKRERRRMHRRMRNKRGGFLPLAAIGGIAAKTLAPALGGLLLKKILKV